MIGLRGPGRTNPLARRLRPALLAGIALVIAGCGIAAQTGSVPDVSAGGPVATTDLAAAGVRVQLASALGARNLILTDAKVPYRPGEPAELASIPRSVFQVQLRDDPTGGFIVVYELPSPELAAAAATNLATWLSSGPGRVQAPSGTIHVLRQVGPDVIYYRWLPGAVVDPDTSGIQAALETVGIGILVAR